MCAYYYDETSANRLLGSRHSICDVCVDVKAMGKGVRSQYSYAIVLGIKMTAGRHEDGHQSDSPLQPNHPVARFFGGVRIGGRL